MPSAPREWSSSTTSVKAVSKTSVDAPQSVRMNESSSATRRQFSATMTPPTLAAPKKVSTNSGPFIRSVATRSPGERPASVSPLATRLQRSLSSGYVWRRPLATSTTASVLGLSNARLVTKRPMLFCMGTAPGGYGEWGNGW